MRLRDLLLGNESAEIICLFKGQVMRRIAVIGDIADIDAQGDAVGVPLDTELRYEAWTFDRGSILFMLDGRVCKLCTEGDTIRFANGVEIRAPGAEGWQ